MQHVLQMCLSFSDQARGGGAIGWASCVINSVERILIKNEQQQMKQMVNVALRGPDAAKCHRKLTTWVDVQFSPNSDAINNRLRLTLTLRPQ